MNIFDCAITKESEAKVTYEKLAAATGVPELKELFTIMAAAEQEHLDALLALKENIPNAQCQFTRLQVAACHFKPLLTQRELIAGLPADPDAYQHVITAEEADARYYEDLAARETDPEISRILRMLATEERKHLNIMENIYSFVESPKNYLAWGEFSNLAEY
jgi:rubrerythrin